MRYRLDIHTDERRDEAPETDVREGLTAWQVPAAEIYQPRGVALFERITELPGNIDAPRRPPGEIVPGLIRNSSRIVESGPLRREPASARGATARGGPAPPRRGRRSMPATSRIWRKCRPALSIHAVVGDFERDLAHVPPPTGRRLALFLGSTIGNLDAPERGSLLAGLRALLPDRGDRLLLGVDLVKDVKVLEMAYDDAAGVTRDFNRNILRVINHAVDGNFEPEAFRHHAFYNEAASRIEMHLVADTAQTVKLGRLGLTVCFRARRGHLDREFLQVHARRRARRAGRRLARPRAVARGPRELLRPGARRAAWRGATGAPPARSHSAPPLRPRRPDRGGGA
jgi:L-histidine N-alpha-methyltransferase